MDTLDAEGYKYSVKGWAPKVSKGAFVLIKGRLVNGLYLLQGSTVIGATSVSSSFDLDTTHLSFMSEVRMPILSKHGLPSNRKFVMPNFCKHRVCRKQIRVRFSTTIYRTKGNIDYVNFDLQNLVLVPSRGSICMWVCPYGHIGKDNLGNFENWWKIKPKRKFVELIMAWLFKPMKEQNWTKVHKDAAAHAFDATIIN